MSRRRPPVPREHLLTYKIASLLLCYPDQRVYAALGDAAEALAEMPDAPPRQALARTLAWLREAGPAACGQHHVAVFDLTRRAGPYLTYYRYGDTRQRGMALLAIKHGYRQAGFQPAGDELPDYLPAVLEFAALAPDGAGVRLLGAHRAGLELMRLALHDLDSPYAHTLDAVSATLAALSPRQAADVRRLVAEGPPAEEVGLDPIGTEPFAPPELLGARVGR